MIFFLLLKKDDEDFSPEDLLNLDKTIQELQQTLKEEKIKSNSLKIRM